MVNNLVSVNSKNKSKVMAFKSNGEPINVKEPALIPEKEIIRHERKKTSYTFQEVNKLIEGFREMVKQALIEVEYLISALDMFQDLDEKLLQNAEPPTALSETNKSGIQKLLQSSSINNLLKSPEINNLLQSPEVHKLLQSPEINNLVGSLFANKSK